MITIVEIVNHLIKFWQLRNLMTKSTRNKRTFQVINFNIGIDMILLMKTKEIWSLPSRRESEISLNPIKSNLKNTEINTHKRCLRMLQSSKSSKPKRMRRPETSKKQLLRSLKLTTRL